MYQVSMKSPYDIAQYTVSFYSFNEAVQFGIDKSRNYDVDIYCEDDETREVVSFKRHPYANRF